MKWYEWLVIFILGAAVVVNSVDLKQSAYQYEGVSDGN